MTQPLPNPFSQEDRQRIEEALRQLGAVARPLIERCKRCNIPVEGAEQDCNALTTFLQGVLAEFFGPQAPLPHRQ